MSPNGGSEVTANVQKVLDTLVHDPQLMREFDAVLARLLEKAGVTLTRQEKAAFFSELGAWTKRDDRHINIWWSA